jgi:pyruvate,phosphate dikinase
MKTQGRKVILVRVETSPEDIHGMHAAEGILTTRGGMTSHAAVVARGMGKPCVSGAGAIRVDYAAATLSAAGTTLRKGDIITIDGSTGQVLVGKVAMLEPALSGEFSTLMGWADNVRKLKVRANADTPNDARVALRFGAEGIGLARTEHMFFEADRIRAVREMILADDERSRRAALAKLLPMQRDDFIELFKIMGGLPVTIRLLDPPLHEFLPHTEKEIAEVAAAMNADPKKLADRSRELQEFNPMLGFRGCRLAIAYPEIAEMQGRAIFSFGTNDLTQTTFGISRDDAASFLGTYTGLGIFPTDPFVSIDRDGVGELVTIAAERGRKTRRDLKLGICGEHGGDPASVKFCHEIGLDYVSCSPFRVPIARLAAAQAALGKGAASTA